MLLTEEMKNLVPSAIVQYLDRYIIGQEKAKRAVAVALRNRLRRRKLPDHFCLRRMPAEPITAWHARKMRR